MSGVVVPDRKKKGGLETAMDVLSAAATVTSIKKNMADDTPKGGEQDPLVITKGPAVDGSPKADAMSRRTARLEKEQKSWLG